MPVFATSDGVALALIELGAIILGLALLARVSDRIGISPIPAYLVAGLLFGDGGLAAPHLSADFLNLAAEVGVVLLLLTLGLEYSADELSDGIKSGWRAGVLDLVLNAIPGALAAFALGWSTEAAVLLAGVTYISSSGVVAKVLTDLGRLGNRETPAVLTVLVIEDLVMAAYLPIVAVMLAGQSFSDGFISVVVALAVAGSVLIAALRFGHHFTRVLHARTDEALLLGLLGVTLLVAGVAQRLDVSAAVGAFLVGIALSGPLQARATTLIAPLRDLFAAVFFVLFGFSIDPASLPSVLAPAAALALVTALTKVATGWYATARLDLGPPAQMRAGTALIARGEFSIVIAGLARSTRVESDLVALAGAYVLLLAVIGPIVTRYADQLRRALGTTSREGSVALSTSPNLSNVNTIRTLGHGTLPQDEFLALVHGADLEAIVDIRRFPGSRRNPQFSVEAMATWLPEHGVEYRWLSSLGGRRKLAPDSPNTGLRNEQFRAYADHMTSDEFLDGITELCALTTSRRIAVMCAESVWWRCHRRLLADHLVLIERTRVEHLFHDGRLDAHVPMPEARRVDDHLVYDPPSSQPASSMPASRK